MQDIYLQFQFFSIIYITVYCREIRDQIAAEVKATQTKHPNFKPGLAIVQVTLVFFLPILIQLTEPLNNLTFNI